MFLFIVVAVVYCGNEGKFLLFYSKHWLYISPILLTRDLSKVSVSFLAFQLK